MAIQFHHNYQLLELDRTSDWKKASENYRRLVHVWHPDRFAQRPRERVHAQQQFIELTIAFNNLRAFYREHNRMPYEQIKQSIADSPEPPIDQRVTPVDDTVFESGILNKRKPSYKSLNKGLLQPLFWIVPTGATILAGLVVFAVIDRNTKESNMEAAISVLETTEPSEYMRNNEEISKVNSRSLLLNKSTDSSKMGDKLTKDLFR